MNEVFDAKIEGRINAILDDLNYVFESVTQHRLAEPRAVSGCAV